MVVFPAIGAFLNKQKGKFRKYLILFPLFNVAAFTFCYTKMGLIPVWTVILTIAYTLTAFNTSAYGVTLMSLMNEIANNADERSLLSSRSALWQNDSKFLYALTGTAILAFTIKLVGGETVGAYTILALAVSLFALLTCLVDYFITSGYEKFRRYQPKQPRQHKRRKKFRLVKQ